MLRSPAILLISALLLVVLLVACGGADDVATTTRGGGSVETTLTMSPTIAVDPSATPAPSELAGTEWVLASLNDTSVDGSVTITLSFDEDGGSGNTGCNDYYVNAYTATENEFSVSEIAINEEGCPESGSVLESTYIDALGNAASYHLVDDRLELADADGTTTLVFTAADVSAAAVPTIAADTAVITTPSPIASDPPAVASFPTPITPHVDLSPLDDPEIGVTVHWLGERFEPDGELPILSLASVYGPAAPGGGPVDSRGELQYSDEPFGSDVKLRLMRRVDWDAWIARDPASDDHARMLHMFWDSPCAQHEEIELDGGRAVIYSSYQVLAAPMVTECPDGPFDRFLAHVFIGDTVVLVNAPHFLEPPDMPSFQGAYNTVEGLRAVVNGLQSREPVTEPTPFPAPAADLADPRTLVLQPADLPGRYGYGDDGCSPAFCNIGPGYFSSEGEYDALQLAAGEFLSTYMQYEHVGFNSEGAPDAGIEPPRIDSFALVCVDACDPAAILEAGPDLLRYYGHSDAVEVETKPNIGDAARLYQTNTLVLGQVSTGHAVVWRDGPVIGFVVVGGAPEEHGSELALEMAASQEERIKEVLSQ